MSLLYKQTLEFIRNSPAVFLIISLIIFLNILANLFNMGSIIEYVNQDDKILQTTWIITSLLMSPNYPIPSALTVIILILIGPYPEKVYGSVKFTIMFLLTGIIGGFYYLYLSSNDFIHCSILSNIGLVGVYFGLYIKRNQLFYYYKHSLLISLVILVAVLIYSANPIELLIVGVVPGFILSFIFRPQTFKKLIQFNARKAFIHSFSIIIVTYFILSFPKFSVLVANADLTMTNFNLQAMTLTDHYTGFVNPTYINEETATEGWTDYEKILIALRNMEPSVTIDIKDEDKAWVIVHQVLDEHPEIFYFDAASSSFMENGSFEFKYLYSKDEVVHLQKQIENKVIELFSNIDRTKMSEDQIVKAIHDFIILHTDFDLENIQLKNVPKESQTIVGSLINRVADSQGYAKTMQFFLKQIGIENIYVRGTYKDYHHAWNKVKIYGEWYNVDVALDEPARGRKGHISYTYFLVTDEFLAKSHSWDQESYPKANDTTFMKQ